MSENTSPVKDFDRTPCWGRSPVPPRGPAAFVKWFSSNAEKMSKRVVLQNFKRMIVSEMSCDERESHLYELAKVFEAILWTNYIPNGDFFTTKEMREAILDSLRQILLGPGGDASLSDFFLQLLPQTDLFLELTPPSVSEYILSLVSGEGWWDITGSELLMRDMERSRERSIVLLKYGYPYSFEMRYFLSLCVSMGHQLKSLPEEVFEKMIVCQGSLRLQMAFEILVAVFDEGDSSDKGILSLLWKTVPHPFISSTEMFQLMAPFFVEYPQKLRDLCEDYVKRNNVFAVPEVTSPRSLLHLCRVRVRKDFLDAKKLSDVTIEGLHLPSSLKDYLKLDFF